MVSPKLETGVRMLETVRADTRRATSACNSARSLGPIPSGYPFFDPQLGPNTNVVLRARDAKKLARAKRAVEDMLERVRGAQSSGA